MKRLVIGISGATGAIYGIRALEITKKMADVETHFVLTEAGALTVRQETNYQIDEVKGLADCVYDNCDIGAAIASGSFRTEGMIIAPCSIKSMAMISNSINANLLIRAADVTLKEKKKLVLLVRETPLHLGHLRLMVNLAEAGVTIHPPMPAFYNKPESLDDIVNHTIGRALDHFDLAHQLYKPWKDTGRTAG
jgi:flavin prenyltransferase